MRRAVVAWAPPVLWAAGIFTLSSLSLGGAPVRVRNLDKVVHFCEYAVLALLLCRALRLTVPAWSPRRSLLTAAAIATLWGGSDEIHQAFVPERTPEWGDVAADVAGALAGAGAWTLLLARLNRPRDAPAS